MSIRSTYLHDHALGRGVLKWQTGKNGVFEGKIAEKKSVFLPLFINYFLIAALP